MEILKEVIQFVLPCWLINMSLNGIYVIKLYFPRIEILDRPFDCSLIAWDGRRVIGSSTTWMGVVVALAIGLLVQNIVPGQNRSTAYGLLTGFLVYFGHALGSFIKRRFGYSDGQFMPFVDHADYVLLSGIVLGLMHVFQWQIIFVGVMITYLLHPLVTYISYLIGWHKYPL